MNNTHYIGLDIHKDTVAIVSIHYSSRENTMYHGTYGGSNLAIKRALRRLAKLLKVKLQ